MVEGLEEPLELDKEASFVVVSQPREGEFGDDERSSDGGDADPSGGDAMATTIGGTRRLYYDEGASLYVSAAQEVDA